MSNDTANLAFTKLENTETSPLKIDSSVTTLALKGNDPAINVDSTTAIDVVLTSAQLLQAATTQLIIDNETGAADISLLALASASSTATTRAAQLQSVLKLGSVGSTAKLTFIRNGSGTSVVELEGEQILGLGQTNATVLIEATNVTSTSQTNTISAVGGGDAYVQATWTPSVTGTGGAGPITLTGSVANYTQIGNRVLFDVQVQAIGSQFNALGAEGVLISLPPVAIGASTSASFAVGDVEAYTAGANDADVVARGVATESNIRMQVTQNNDTAPRVLAGTDFINNGTTCQINVSGQYLV